MRGRSSVGQSRREHSECGRATTRRLQARVSTRVPGSNPGNPTLQNLQRLRRAQPRHPARLDAMRVTRRAVSLGCEAVASSGHQTVAGGQGCPSIHSTGRSSVRLEQQAVILPVGGSNPSDPTRAMVTRPGAWNTVPNRCDNTMRNGPPRTAGKELGPPSGCPVGQVTNSIRGAASRRLSEARPPYPYPFDQIAQRKSLITSASGDALCETLARGGRGFKSRSGHLQSSCPTMCLSREHRHDDCILRTREGRVRMLASAQVNRLWCNCEISSNCHKVKPLTVSR